MLRTLTVLGLAACCLPAALGCGGLEARRGPVEKRLAGKDTCYDGFRYYLSRPYLVVSARVDVVTTTQKARIVLLKGARADPVCHVFQSVFLEAIDEHGCPTYFDLYGRPQPALADKEFLTLDGELAI